MESEFGRVIPLIVLFVVFGGIFYFLLIRPQRKKQQEHQNLINKLSKGDEVITAGGIHGSIQKVLDESFIVEIDEGTRIKVEKDSIAEKETKEEDDQEEENGGS